MDARELEDKQREASINKLMAETLKLTEEGVKLSREGMKLHAEGLKLRHESRWYPVVWATAMMGIIVTLLKTIH